jgi:hypothetical protein
MGLQEDLAGVFTKEVLGVKLVEVEPAIVLSSQKVLELSKSNFILLLLVLQKSQEVLEALK